MQLNDNSPKTAFLAGAGLLAAVTALFQIRRCRSSKPPNKQTRATSTRYDKPVRPVFFHCLNAALWLAERLGINESQLCVERLMATARRATNLEDFGDLWFVEPLTVLVDSINKEAGLSPFGRLAQRETLVRHLSNRLRVEAYLKKYPEVLEIDIGKVIVIASLQRTGTTMLLRMLAADARARSLLGWEAVNPAPFEGEEEGDPVQRIAHTTAMIEWLAFLSPDLFAVHPLECESPEEECVLLEMSFLSQIPEACMHVPTYAKWRIRQNVAPAYRYLHLLLQILTHQRKGAYWVLKTPNHMEHFDVLLKTFPKVVVVQTHRDPQQTTASFCSMICHTRGVFTDRVDVKSATQHWLGVLKYMMRRCIDVRESAPSDKFVDIYYKDLLSDPMKQIARVYDAAGIRLTTEARDQMEAASKRNTQHRYGKHVYHPQHFGLTRRGIEEQFGFYREKFAIPWE